MRWVDNYNKYKSDNPEIDLEQYDQKFNIDELRMKLNKYYNPIKLVISEKTECNPLFVDNPSPITKLNKP